MLREEGKSRKRRSPFCQQRQAKGEEGYLQAFLSQIALHWIDRAGAFENILKSKGFNSLTHSLISLLLLIVVFCMIPTKVIFLHSPVTSKCRFLVCLSVSVRVWCTYVWHTIVTEMSLTLRSLSTATERSPSSSLTASSQQLRQLASRQQKQQATQVKQPS